MYSEEVKKAILEKGIIRSEDDWNMASPSHLALAKLFFDLMNSGLLPKRCPSVEEKVQFLDETEIINDISELEEVDRVVPNKTFESDSIKLGVPVELVPLIRQIYSEMMEEKQEGI